MGVDLVRWNFKFHKFKKLDRENQRRIIIALKNMLNIYAREAGVSPDEDDYKLLFGLSKSKIRQLGYGAKVPVGYVNKRAQIPIDGIIASGAKFMFSIDEDQWRRYIQLEEHRKNAESIQKKHPGMGFERDLEIDAIELGMLRDDLKKSIRNWEKYYGIMDPEYRIIVTIRKYYCLTPVDDVTEYVKCIDTQLVQSISADKRKELRKYLVGIIKLIDAM